MAASTASCALLVLDGDEYLSARGAAVGIAVVRTLVTLAAALAVGRAALSVMRGPLRRLL
jgi:hypothetical protein